MEVQRCCWKPYFYPRPPRGGRLPSMLFWAQPLPFLSTPSARRATPDGLRYAQRPSYFYPRPPRGGRQRLFDGLSEPFDISIHALREEGDDCCHSVVAHLLISIHALREEGDYKEIEATYKHVNFYPRPPRGGRHWTVGTTVTTTRFLSTPSARRATRGSRPVCSQEQISIHALREEGDSCSAAVGPMGQHFYPRPPRGGRQQKQRQNLYFQTNYTTFCTNLEEP